MSIEVAVTFEQIIEMAKRGLVTFVIEDVARPARKMATKSFVASLKEARKLASTGKTSMHSVTPALVILAAEELRKNNMKVTQFTLQSLLNVTGGRDVAGDLASKIEKWPDVCTQIGFVREANPVDPIDGLIGVNIDTVKSIVVESAKVGTEGTTKEFARLMKAQFPVEAATVPIGAFTMWIQYLKRIQPVLGLIDVSNEGLVTYARTLEAKNLAAYTAATVTSDPKPGFMATDANMVPKAVDAIL
jgi:hypothetical protein